MISIFFFNITSTVHFIFIVTADSHYSFTSMKLFFNCFHCLQWNLCLVTVDWWPSDALFFATISWKSHKCECWKLHIWFVMHLSWKKIFVHLFVSVLVLHYFLLGISFLSVFCLLIFRACIFLWRPQIGMNYRIACYRNMRCLIFCN